MYDQAGAELIWLAPEFQPFSGTTLTRQNDRLTATNRNTAAATKSRRFECFPEPSGGWLVWDNDADEPGMLSEVLLSGVSQHQAFLMTNILNGLRSRSNLLSCRNEGPTVLLCISTPKQAEQ